MGNIRQFFADQRAVTPVIGTIIIVAIAVVLGAVVSAYALGVTADVGSPAPQASFDFKPDYTSGNITVTKTSGDTINGDQLKFSGAALEKTTDGSITEWAGKDIRAGASATVNVVSGESLTLIWQSPEGGKTAMLAEYDVPNDVGPSGSVSITNVQSVTDEVTVSVGTLGKISGKANLVVETPSGGYAEREVDSGDTVILSPSVVETETVTATLYESGETGVIASDTGSASTEASFDSFSYSDNSGTVNVNNIQFNGVQNDRVWIVAKDGNEDSSTSDSKWFANNGGDTTLYLTGYYVKDEETVSVTVYDTDSESNKLTSKSCVADRNCVASS